MFSHGRNNQLSIYLIQRPKCSPITRDLSHRYMARNCKKRPAQPRLFVNLFWVQRKRLQDPHCRVVCVRAKGSDGHLRQVAWHRPYRVV